MAKKQAAPETAENVAEYTPFDRVADLKWPTTVYVGAVLLGCIMLPLGVVGYFVMGAPFLLSMIPAFGRFIDIGPVFTTFSQWDEAGQRWVTTTSRDYLGQYSANVLLTFGKYILMFILSIIVTPVIAFVCIIKYNKAYKEAKTYADANGISHNEIPGISKKLILAAKILLIIVAVVLVVMIIVALPMALAETANKNDHRDKFPERFNAMPEQYYAEGTYYHYLNGIQDAGWVASFQLEDGRWAYCGQVYDEYDNYKDTYVRDGSQYCIIDGDIYVMEYPGSSDWELVKDAATEEYLLIRHLHTIQAEDLENNIDIDFWGEDDSGVEYEFQTNYGTSEICFNADGTLYSYTPDSNYDRVWTVQESDFAEAKAMVEEVLATVSNN